MKDHEKFTDEFANFIEGGFIAIKQGDEDAANKLFLAAHTLKPEHTAPLLGLGHVHLNKMELGKASAKFEEVLKKEPQNAVARILLGFCFLLPKLGIKRKKTIPMQPEEMDRLAIGGKAMIEEGLKTATDPEIVKLGKSALELLSKVATYRESPLKGKG
jgi:hypothetical protein